MVSVVNAEKRVRLGAAVLVRLGVLCLLVSSGCSARPPVPLRATPANEWDALIRAGCFSCLREALAALEAAGAVRGSPALARTAFSASTLLVVRARELGLPDDQFLERARFWGGRLAPSPNQLPPSVLFDALALIHGDTTGLPSAERDRRADQQRMRWPHDGSAPPARMALSPFVRDDVAAAYVALTLDCENGQAPAPADRDRSLAQHPVAAIQFRLQVCAGDEDGLRRLYETDRRWVETLAVRGRLALVRYPSPSLPEAARLLAAARREFGESDSIGLALAGVQNALGDHASALAVFDDVLARQSRHPDALQGRMLSLSHLKRHAEAAAVATTLIDLFTDHVAEAWYWRAWNRYQVQQLPDAWHDITEATMSGGSSSAYLLAGVIAYARQWPFAAIDRLQTAFALDPAQCEAPWLEGQVRVDQEEWRIAGDRFASAVTCFGSAADQAKHQLAFVQGAGQTDAPGDPRLERMALEQLASAQGRVAQSAYNAASSYARAGDQAAALRYVAIAAGHPSTQQQSGELRRRILQPEPAPR